MKVVLDCNVIISAGVADGTACDVVLNVLRNHTCIVSPEIIAEYARVIQKTKFSKHFHKLKSILREISKNARMCTAQKRPITLSDSSDEIYLTAYADVLITGNTKDFPRGSYEGVLILPPHEFLDLEKNT